MKEFLRPMRLFCLFLALLVADSCNSVYNDYPALSMHYYVNGEYYERNEDLANPSVFFSTYYEAPLFINNDNNEISDPLRFTMRACMADIRIIADTLVFLEGVKYCYGNWDKTRYTAEGKEIPHRKLIDAKVDLYGILLPNLDYSISLMDLQSAWFVFNKIDQDHICYTVNFEMDYLCMHCTDTVRIRGGQLDVYDVTVDHKNLYEKYELYITEK